MMKEIISDKKNIIRQQIKNQIIWYSQDDYVASAKSKMATDIFVKSSLYRESSTILTYVAKKTEISTRFIIEKAFEDNKDVAVPKVVGDDLDFYYLDSKEPLENQLEVKSFGILEPKETLSKLDKSLFPVNSIIIVPGLGFTPSGIRLGHGKGFYDRFINSLYASNSSIHLPKALIGFCFDFQIKCDLPYDEHDIPMTNILSEHGLDVC